MRARREFRCFAILKRISEPFDAGRYVELSFKFEDGSGEIQRRIPADEASDWYLGKVLALSMMPV
jgi:hypothetical protein